jgi:hypothetical protein
MPYVPCPACGLQTYSAAGWAGTDKCPGCGVELPARSGRFASIASLTPQVRTAQIESARAALLRLRQRAGEG